MVDWSDEVSQLRESLQWTQNDLANRMRGIGFLWSRETVAGIERGIRKLEATELLGLRYLGLDLDRVGWSPRLVASTFLPTQAEQRAAKSLGCTSEEVRKWAMYCWGVPLEVERNRRAGVMGFTRYGRAERGRAMRRLVKELRGVIADDKVGQSLGVGSPSPE